MFPSALKEPDSCAVNVWKCQFDTLGHVRSLGESSWWLAQSHRSTSDNNVLSVCCGTASDFYCIKVMYLLILLSHFETHLSFLSLSAFVLCWLFKLRRIVFKSETVQWKMLPLLVYPCHYLLVISCGFRDRRRTLPRSHHQPKVWQLLLKLKMLWWIVSCSRLMAHHVLDARWAVCILVLDYMLFSR